MSIVKVSQIAPGRAGKAFNDFNREYTVPFQVIVDNSRDGLFVMANATDPNTGVRIPLRYAPYIGYENANEDIYALCTDLEINQDGKSWQKWIVNAKFTTNFQIQKAEDPEDDPPVFWVETEFETRDATREYDGTPIRNSAGELLAGLKKIVAVKTFCILRNELQINPLSDSYNCSINSAAFNGRAKYTLLLQITTDKQQRRGQYVYWPHTYKLKYDPDDWTVDPADVGTKVVAADGSLVEPVDNKNRPISPPVNLDGNGKLLAQGQDMIFLSGATTGQGNGTNKPKMLYRPRPFNALNLPAF